MEDKALEKLNERLESLLDFFTQDPTEAGVFLDDDSDPAGTRLYLMKKEAAELVLKTSAEVRKNREADTKAQVLKSNYIHRKELEKVIESLYTIFINSIGYSRDPDKQLENVQEGIQDLLSEL